MNINNRGLTLIEILVAFAISSIIVLGTYALFKSTTDIRIDFGNKSELTKIQTSLTILFNRDLNSATDDEPDLSEYNATESISFVTYNSFYFNGAVPVTVTYALNGNYLVREEKNEQLGYRQVIKLINNIDKFDVYYFDGNEYTKNKNKNFKIVKVEVEINKQKFEIIAGKFRI